MSYSGKTPEQIEDEIRDTQQRMDRHISSLQESLSPSRLISNFVPGVNGNGQGVANDVVRLVRDNPVRSAMVGAGVMLLLGGAAASSALSETTPRRRTGTYSDPARRIGEGISDLSDTVSEGVDEARRRAEDASHKAWRSAKRTANEAGDTLKAVPERVRSIGEQGVEWTKANPIPTGLLCVAAGAAIASIFTMRRPGNDNAVDDEISADTARETASTLKEAREAGEETVGKAKSGGSAKTGSTKSAKSTSTKSARSKRASSRSGSGTGSRKASTTRAGSSTAGSGSDNDA